MRIRPLLAAVGIAISSQAAPAASLLICKSDANCATPCGQGICVRGTCDMTPLAKGTLCRAKNGDCDVAEFCDGANLDCPQDAFLPATTECRKAAGVCDVAEHCTGTGPDCPANTFADSTVVCRPAAGICDVEEKCTGQQADCPKDQLVGAGTICRPAANDCDLADACTGISALCPNDATVPAGTACESASACVSGGTCAGPVCIGGQPELTFAPDLAEFAQDVHDVEVAIKHTGSGGPITLTGATISPAGTFSIVAAPQWPLSLPAGSQAKVTVRLAADAPAGEHSATLSVQANNCADQPVQLHANVASAAPDAGPADAGSGSGSGGSSSAASPGVEAKGGGCSSAGTPAGTLALVALGSVALRRRRGRAPSAA